ncbi:AzlC family protein [Beutenbergia cavernae DSM 12333]|uniref:AzlC family protein n=1 Tax=Beutenbergia cavernae (strain ATCC BAA-8 / DSM 12333 / CCUG 43141 / JCM 11478 / NBRC 16432 / NCIMB 13614 / HKI 0122) TaxID=471853 RepID=C5BWQ1_BEUC1|nr:AzlC family ABC transporter permease [Beutenbergia cavernae]ACQ80717.1 AzlC family protein [Beutenbergia cavernae DSM 12333]
MPDEPLAPDAGSAVAARGATLRQALSVSIATALYGVSFGALAIAAGLGLGPTMALSLLMFSGGSQFAYIGIAASGGSPTAAIATAGLLGVRNGLYGLQLSPLLALEGWRRVAAAHLTIDESTAVAAAQPTRGLSRVGFWWTGLGVFVGWNAMTFAGALLGDLLGDPRRWGLDAAAAAAFLALVWPRLADPLSRWAAAGAVVVALALVPVTPPGIPVLGAAVVAIVLGWRTPSTPTATPSAPSPGAIT